MKKTKFYAAVLLILSFIAMPVTAFAIGQWVKGTVTKAPWTKQYTYIQINNVKYTIMKDTGAVKVYTKNGAEYKEKIKISSIRRGAILLVKVEGNRIYTIEKIR